MGKTKSKLIEAFYILFAVCFTFVMINVVFCNRYYKTPYLVIVTILCIIGFYLIYRLLGKFEPYLEKNYRKILIIFTAAMFILEMVMGLALRHESYWDIGAVNNGAIEWVNTGTFAGYFEYFGYFPNNLGAMMFYFIFFKIASFFGMTDYYAVAVFLDAVMLVITMALVSLICRRLSGSTKTGVLALVLFTVSVQFWFLASLNYTDVMSMLFPVLTFWLYLKSKEKTGRDKIIFYLLMGFSIIIGSLIKFTAMIMIVAILIDMCLKEKIKETLKAAVCIIGVIAVIMSCFNLYIYSAHLDREQSRVYNTPILHWVMMGLNGDGFYNPGDYELTRAIAPDDRNSELLKEIGRRLNERGISGTYDLVCKKTSADFGDGTYALGDFLYMSPAYDVKLHDWVLDSGEKHSIFGHYTTAVHITIMLFMLLCAYCFIFSKDKRKNEFFIPYLAVLGIWIFLMGWETGRRYFTNFGPVIIMCGTLGMTTVMETAPKIAGSLKKYIKS